MDTLEARYTVNLRDKVASKLANAVLAFATPMYRNFVRGSMFYGMASAVRDEREGRPSPQDELDEILRRAGR